MNLPNYPDQPMSPDATTRMMRYDSAKKSAGLTYLLWFFVGALGVHRFYLGQWGVGALMLACTLLGWALFFIPNGIIGAIALVEGVIYLTRSDAEFHDRYEIGRRPWF